MCLSSEAVRKEGDGSGEGGVMDGKQLHGVESRGSTKRKRKQLCPQDWSREEKNLVSGPENWLWEFHREKKLSCSLTQ